MAALAFLLLIELIWLLILTLNRLVLLYRFNPPEIWSLYRGDLWPAFQRGFLFDLKVTGFLCVPYLVVAVLGYFLGRGRSLQWMQRLSYLLWPLCLTILLIDQQYYAFFQSHINILVFGVMEDDTGAVLRSVWTDHPVVRIVLIYVVTNALIFWGQARARVRLLRWPKFSAKKVALAYALYLPVHVMCMRGSFGIFPLQRDDAIVSNHPFLNYLVVNGFFAFKEALQDKAVTKDYLPEPKILAKYKMKSLHEALGYLGKQKPDDLYARSHRNRAVEKTPPNVVYVMMESWGNFLFDYHDPVRNNILGSFEKHFKQDYVFRNFSSSTNGTITSLEALLTGKEVTSLLYWNSSFRFNSLPSALARPFKEQGYRTVFITSGKMGWRNANQWVPKQYFDEVYGQNEIMRKFSDAEDCSWGVYDEYSFRLAQTILADRSRPLFIFVMTTSNHTPYELPSHFRPLPTEIPAQLTNTITTSRDLAEKSLRSFQYVNNSLGNFIDFVKGDPALAAKTIFVATGDHNMWTLMPQNAQILAAHYKNSVPLYFYVPPYLRGGLHFDPDRPGSHKDIMPTITELALSDARYFAQGNNLFADLPRDVFFGTNDSAGFHPLGYQGSDPKLVLNKMRAFFAVNQIYFQREFCRIDKSWCH